MAPITITPPIVPVGSASEARLVNLSTRARVTDANPLITGFAISGTEPRPVLVRAAGPGLAGFGVTGAIAAPRLELRAADGTLVAENTGWRDAAPLANAFASAGAFPFAPGSADSAAVVTLAPGSYTVQVLDASDGTTLTGSGQAGGVALAEIYDLGGTTGDSRLVNVSTRTTVAAGGGEFISGFVLEGTAPRQFLLRGIGPGLAKFNVNGALADPILSLFDSTGRQIALNDNWSGTLAVAAIGTATGSGTASVTVTVTTVLLAPLATQTAAASAASAPVTAAATSTGAFALDLFSKDAAFVTTLAPGAYTVQVSGADIIAPTVATGSSTGAVAGSTSAVATTAVIGPRTPAAPGIALLEIYELP